MSNFNDTFKMNETLLERQTTPSRKKSNSKSDEPTAEKSSLVAISKFASNSCGDLALSSCSTQNVDKQGHEKPNQSFFVRLATLFFRSFAPLELRLDHVRDSKYFVLLVTTVSGILVAYLLNQLYCQLVDWEDPVSSIGGLSLTCYLPLLHLAPWCPHWSDDTSYALPDLSKFKSPFKSLIQIQNQLTSVTHTVNSLSEMPLKWQLATFPMADLRDTMRYCTDLEHQEEMISLLGVLINEMDGTAVKLRKFVHHFGSAVDTVTSANHYVLQNLRKQASPEQHGFERPGKVLGRVVKFMPYQFRFRNFDSLELYSELAGRIEVESGRLAVEAESISSHLRVVDKTINRIRATAWNDLESQTANKDAFFFSLWHRVMDTLKGIPPTLEDPSRTSMNIQMADGLRVTGRETWSLLASALQELKNVKTDARELKGIIHVRKSNRDAPRESEGSEIESQIRLLEESAKLLKDGRKGFPDQS